MASTRRIRSLPRRWPWLWLPVAACGAAAGAAAAWLSGTSGGLAHLYPAERHPAPFHQDKYTFGSSSCSPTTWKDPINVVFVGAEAWSGSVKQHAARSDHGGWTNHSGSQQYFWDHGQCEPKDDQSADGGSLDSRYHMRYNQGDIDGSANFDASLPGGGGFYVLAAAHHEDFGVVLCNTGPPLYDGYPGHAVDGNEIQPPGGFNMARTEILWRWLNSPHYHPNLGFFNWGNTEPMRQCNQEYAWSDGWVRFIGIGSPGGGGDSPLGNPGGIPKLG
jgi:hypothetical protein